MKSFNHRFPWQVLVLIALLLAGCGESISSKSAGNSLSQHGSTPTASMITEFVIPTLGSHPQDMVVGPDGNLWFTEFRGDKIGRITPRGALTEFAIPVPGFTGLIVAASDGALWFQEYGHLEIGRVTVNGTVQMFASLFPTVRSYPQFMVAGTDGALRFTEASGNKIGRITPSGSSPSFLSRQPNSSQDVSSAGPDGNLLVYGDPWQ